MFLDSQGGVSKITKVSKDSVSQGTAKGSGDGEEADSSCVKLVLIPLLTPIIAMISSISQLTENRLEIKYEKIIAVICM